ncbi:AsmA protein [Photobacterium aquae]|uniref:AsmA protein n=1 Tax=Photobacterium aquae TaxID=1195763 RepID=A0A0J1H142_9GAMM|nr:AsmA family protein [Photobacterium aquae]KLV05543.1 AsmA protein [Photobacterium aquae]
MSPENTNHNDKVSTPAPTRESKRNLRKIAKWAGIGVLTPVALCVATLGYGIHLDLTPYRTTISEWLTENLDREARIDGEIKLVLSFRPEVQFNGISIANTDAFNWQPLLKTGSIHAQIGILPLLGGTLSVDHLELDTIELNLAKDSDGDANWLMGNLDRDNQASSQNNDAQTRSPLKLAINNKISAHNLSFVYQDHSTDTYFDWYLDDMLLAPIDNQWQLNASGSIIGQQYNLELIGDLEQLLNEQYGKLQAKGEFAGASLNIDADVLPINQGISTADVSLSWQNTQPVANLLGLDLQYLAPLNITTKISASANRLKVSELAIDSPITHGSGFLDIALGDHNTIDGKLNIPLIDLRPWLEPKPIMMRAYSSAPPQQSPLQRALDQWLVKTTTNVELSIDEVKGLGTSIENLSLQVNGKAGELHAPMTADIAKVPFRGSANINATDWTSTVDVTLGAEKSPLGEMARWLSGMGYARGHLESAKLNITTQGTKLSEWLENSRAELNIDQAEVKWGGDASFAIDKAKLIAGLNVPFKSDIQGQLMGIPTRFKVKAGTFCDVLSNRDWPTQISLNSPALHVSAEGLLKHTRWEEDSWFNLDIQSKDAKLLSPWLGTTADIHGPVNITGKIRYHDGWIKLAMPDFNLLNSKGNINMAWRPEGERPYLDFDANFSELNFTQFGQFINNDELPQVEQTVPTQGVNLDVPLLPNDIVIADADVNIGVKQLIWGKQHLEAISFKGELKNGRMSNAPFKSRFAGSDYNGLLNFGINANTIDAALDVSVEDPDIGAVLHQFNIADDFDMRLDRAQLALSIEGRSVLDLMENTKVDARLLGGYANIADSYTGKALKIQLDEGRFQSGPDTDTQLVIDGTTAGKVTQIALNSLSLKKINDGRETLPVDLAVNLGDMRFKAHTSLSLPIDPQALNLDISAYAPNLDQLETFTNIDMPPYGPVTINANMAMDKRGYHLNNMLVQVNNSQLTGQGAYLPPLNNQGKPQLNLALTAPFIQMDDFKVGDWAAWQNDKMPVEEEKTTPSLAANTSDSPTSIISPAGLDMLNARFSLDVNEVRSGDDWLGAGKLDWTVKDGVFNLKPLYIQLPGGSIDLASTIKAKDDMFDLRFDGHVENFDYGILARRLAPESGMHGTFSTQFQLTSLANSPDTLLNNANGFIGVAAWPKAFEADLIDLWAVSLTDAIIPNFTNNDPSVLNCVAAGIDIKQGTMKQRDLLLDTTRMQVNGLFNASYADRDFSLYLRPQSKRAQIFSLQTPVEVLGKFEHFDFSVPLSAILETSVRFTTSPVVSPIRWLVEKPIAPDGSAQCQLIWQGKH